MSTIHSQGDGIDALELANLVRTCAEWVFRSRRLGGRCAIVTFAFWKAARDLSIPGVGSEGGYFVRTAGVQIPRKPEFGNREHIAAKRWIGKEPHAWNYINGRIVDLTATQFDRTLPGVFVPAITDSRYVPRDGDWCEFGEFMLRLIADDAWECANRLHAEVVKERRALRALRETTA